MDHTVKVENYPKSISGKKDDVIDGKLNYMYIHPHALYQVGAAFSAGKDKYGAWNYLNGHKASVLQSAAKRHMDAWFYAREEYDEDCSNRVGMDVSHLANAIAELVMALGQIAEGTIVDDRPEHPLKFKITKK